ncbi:DUF1007 family protein [Sinorhizobium meliloti WSM1022]|jgi:ABC-type uncharacterized transport system substrate-binding protein|uniref:ABC transporter substrate-binding protein n=5 Tax=Sinorhizobium TaxID=28105 RepID=Q92LY5_RHIME|nr:MULTISPECIES: DUF1007 family protein [Sinorhizobium]TWA96451.1 ABC-type uncharacterized transport system substrate-binding protein [Ensifer sp. SEMIA 134]TWB31601.1 ABC-type uncharacterized transport system substrate-binding protein [Ensifer sp. SEMIA 135]AEG05603.1 protein of unknown function DUF1007 [Sinorhizobium meliloti BL225C]AEG54638.1 protein of unknown function DUF1007 [Sinorhizobium meliloti AK83]AGA07905.1 ABC-type uncharacterized transport system, periplasmic component [Sinorhiz
MKTQSIVMAGLATLLAPALAFAHPHIFAEARLEIVSDEKGGIGELRNVWRFDELFSASVVLDFDKNANATLDPDELKEVGQTVLESLAEYNYYTSISDNGKSVKVNRPDSITVDYKDNQLLMMFAVKPAETMPLKGKLSFGVYDPTMYTAMDFPTDEDLSVVGDKIEACQHQVVRPDPDEVLAENKDTLTDAFWNDPTGTDTSKLFATRIEITC